MWLVFFCPGNLKAFPPILILPKVILLVFYVVSFVGFSLGGFCKFFKRTCPKRKCYDTPMFFARQEKSKCITYFTCARPRAPCYTLRRCFPFLRLFSPPRISRPRHGTEIGYGYFFRGNLARRGGGIGAGRALALTALLDPRCPAGP